MDSSFDPAPYRCYVAPYGTVGVVCDFLSMYMLYMVFVSGRSPVVFFRRLKHTKWAMWFFGIKAFSQAVLHWHVAIQDNCASQPHSLGVFDYTFIDFPHFLLGPLLIFHAVLVRWYRSMSTLPKSTTSMKHTHGCSQPPYQPQQSPATSSLSTPPSIVEPPPVYAPRACEDSGDPTKGDFEMQNMTQRDTQAVADAAPENCPVQGFAESPRIEEGRGSGISGNTIPPSYDGDKEISSQSPKRSGPIRLHFRGPLLLIMLVSTVLLFLGLRSLADGIPIAIFEETGWTSRESMKRDDVIIHLAFVIIGFFLALALSTYSFRVGPRPRAGERARVRDYCVQLFKRGLVSKVFWSTIIAVLAGLCVVDLFMSGIVIGYAASDRHGLRGFEGDQDAARYWWYVAFSLLPLLSS